MDYGPNATFGTPLYKAWKGLLSMATKQVQVASFYWSMTGEDIHVNSSSDAPVSTSDKTDSIWNCVSFRIQWIYEVEN